MRSKDDHNKSRAKIRSCLEASPDVNSDINYDRISEIGYAQLMNVAALDIKTIPFDQLPSLIEFGEKLTHLSFEADQERGESIVLLDLWLLPNNQMSHLLDARSVLSASEENHALSITHEAYQCRHLAMRILTRLALSNICEQPVSPDAWLIDMNDFGKPALTSDQSSLCFNVSHSDDVSVLVVSRSKNVGIDIERVEPMGMEELPLHVLSKKEQERLEGLERVERYEKFLQIWTMKEAYAKAVGLGFSLNFDEIECCPDPPFLKGLNGVPVQPSEVKALYASSQGARYRIAICIQ